MSPLIRVSIGSAGGLFSTYPNYKNCFYTEKYGMTTQIDQVITYTWSPYVHHMPWHAQYGRWNFLRDTDGVHWTRLSPHYFLLYLFICIWGAMSALVQLIKYKSFLKSCNNNQQSLHSKTSNLCFRRPYYAQPCLYHLLLDSQHQYENSFFWFIFGSWVEGLLVRVLPFLCY